MPWQECTTMSIRREFVLLAEHPQSNIRELCRRYGISQPAYAQQEQATKPRKATREKIASALGIAPQLLDL